eukprot:5224112-Amphidinium_carterae.1
MQTTPELETSDQILVCIPRFVHQRRHKNRQTQTFTMVFPASFIQRRTLQSVSATNARKMITHSEKNIAKLKSNERKENDHTDICRQSLVECVMQTPKR